MKSFIVFTMYLLLLNDLCKAQNIDPIKVSLKMTKNVMDSGQQIQMNISIINNSLKKRKVPDELYIGYENDTNSDMIFYVQKINRNVKLPQVPTSDYAYPDFLQNGKRFIEIGSKKEYDFNLDRFYNLQKGLYRTRAKFVIPWINNLKTKFVYSNWVYFNIK